MFFPFLLRGNGILTDVSTKFRCHPSGELCIFCASKQIVSQLVDDAGVWSAGRGGFVGDKHFAVYSESIEKIEVEMQQPLGDRLLLFRGSAFSMYTNLCVTSFLFDCILIPTLCVFFDIFRMPYFV